MNSSELLTTVPTSPVRKRVKRLRDWQGFHVDGKTAVCEAGNGGLAVSFPLPLVARIRLWLGTYDAAKETGIVTADPSGASDIAARNDGETLKIAGGGLTVLVNRADFTVRVFRGDREIAADAEPASWNRRGFLLRHRLYDGESVYGLGEKTGFLDKRGRRYEMWNSDVFSAHTTTTDPLYVSVPFFIRLSGGPASGAAACGFYLDNSYRSAFDLGESDPDAAEIQAPDGNLDYYLIASENLPGVLARYAELTGKAPLPPRWALGHHQSRYSYKSAEETLQVAQGFTDRNLACASIHLDIHYMDGNRTFTWDEDAFPDPADLSERLAERGIRLTAIIDPAIKVDPEYGTYREMVKNGYCCRYADGRPYVGRVWPGDSVFPDFARQDVRDWWGRKVLAFLDEHGIEGVWHDMNEPAVFNDESTMDSSVCHGGEPMDSHGRIHNLYAYYECMATYEAIRGARKRRPFILSRAGFAGIQKYAALWTGDNRSMWEHLELSLPMILNMGLSGLPFVGADVGGFSYNAAGELMVRWYQLGMFYPFARNHCAEGARRQEPWSFGPETERLLAESMRLRERLMPDLYAAFYLASKNARPVMRPLVWDYPDDSEVRRLYDQFLFAHGLMGAPVLRPGVHIRQAYLPAGVWFDFHTGERLQGGRWILAEAPLTRMPLFARAGSLLVTAPGGAETGYAAAGFDPPHVTLWHDDSVESGEWLAYADDGISFGYEDGDYALVRILWSRGGTNLNLELIREGNPSFPFGKGLSFSVKNPQGIETVSVSDAPVPVTRADGELRFTAETVS